MFPLVTRSLLRAQSTLFTFRQLSALAAKAPFSTSLPTLSEAALTEASRPRARSSGYTQLRRFTPQQDEHIRASVQAAGSEESVDWDKVGTELGRKGSEVRIRYLAMKMLSNSSLYGRWPPLDDQRLMFLVDDFYKGDLSAVDWNDVAAKLGGHHPPEDCQKRYTTVKNIYDVARVGGQKRVRWTAAELETLKKAVETHGTRWALVAQSLPGRSPTQCLHQWQFTCKLRSKKKGRWTPEEDKELTELVQKYGHAWTKIAEMMPGRSKMSCREHWIEVISPTLSKEPYTPEEDAFMQAFYKEHGPRWKQLAEALGNRGRFKLRSRVMFHHAGFRKGPWTEEEDRALLAAVEKLGTRWVEVSKELVNRSDLQCSKRFKTLVQGVPLPSEANDRNAPQRT